MRTRILCLIGLLLTAPLFGQGRYAIRNARIVTVSGDTIERGTVVIADGRISAVGARVRIPSGTRSIDGRGKSVYPGLFNTNTNIGLTEVGQVPVTNDFGEMGQYMPHLLAFSAFHVESEHIPVARADGITHVLTRPSGGRIPGQGAVMNLAGWSPAEMEIDRHAALMLNLPSLMPMGRRFGRGRASRSYTDQKKDFDKSIKELRELFARGRHYIAARDAGNEVEFDKQLEALAPALQGEQVVMIEANSHVDIKEAVQFAQSEKIRYVILGARDAWKAAEFLAEHDVPVIIGGTQSLPVREDDPIDIMYRAPAILHEKGVRFAMATGGSANARTLPWEIGNAVAHGLPHDVALRAVTLNPAEFLGLSDEVGSIEVGKRANLVVTDGDLLEYQTTIHHIFINGEQASLESKHTQLYRKYLSRP